MSEIMPTEALGLTALQRDALLVIQEIIDGAGCPPSLRELRQELELSSTSQVQHLLQRLRERGYVTWREWAARSITVLRRIPFPPEPVFVLSSDLGAVPSAGAPT